LTGEGVSELVQKMEEHRQFLNQEPENRSLGRAEAELTEALRERMVDSILGNLKKEARFQELLKKISDRKIDPASAAEQLLKKALQSVKT
jgi:putative protein kinase ArgK-like GTPase of G3E family